MPDTDIQAIEFDERSGKVRMTFERVGGADTYTLIPPTLGKLRALYEEGDRIDTEVAARAEVKAAEVAAAEAPTETGAPTETPVELPALLKMIGHAWLFEDSGLQSILAWWAKCFELCEADAKPLPAFDDCPAWLGSTSLHLRVLTHWLQFPTLALGTSAPRAAANNGNG